jgi:predicted permease
MLTRVLVDFLKDLRYGGRLLQRSPVFTTVATLSLGLGIGGAAAVFTLVNAVVIRTLPVPEPSQLFVAETRSGDDTSNRFSWPAFERARDEVKGRAELAAATSATGMQITIGGRSTRTPSTERGDVQLVSGEYFDVLRQRPQTGRLLTPADNRTLGAHPVVVISDGFWQRRLGGAPTAVGRELVINGSSFTIVGIAAKGFFGTTVGLRNPDAWIPLMMQPVVRYASNVSSRDDGDTRKPYPPQASVSWLAMFARVPEATDPAAIAAAFSVLHRRAAQQTQSYREDPEERKRVQAEHVVLDPAARGLSNLRRQTSAPLFVLLAMVGVLLAIACGNVASLLLARSTSRQREIAVRLSMGAGRARLVRQLLAESLVLAALGGGIGIVAARWGGDALLTMLTGGTTAPVDLDTSFDWRVLAFAVLVSALTGLLFGLAPAIRGTRVPLVETLKQQSRSVGAEGGRRGLTLGKGLVAGQIAFCLLLLVVAGLFVRSLRALADADIGYDREHVLVARLDLRAAGYEASQLQPLYRRVLERIAAVPGVASASLSLNGPLGNSARGSGVGAVEGYAARPGEQLRTNEEVVTPDYFRTVGLRLVEGRLFGRDEDNPKGRSTIINQTFAKRFFGRTSPIGKRWSYGNALDAEAFVIIGVVEDAKYLELRGDAPNMAYKPVTQTDEHLFSLELRTSGEPANLAPAVRQALSEIEPRMPVVDIGSLDLRVARQLSQDRLVAQLTSAFGAIALLLACLGLYGTISYGVTRRAGELGVRMALGADRGAVLWLVMREALLLVIAGAVAGLPLAFLAGRSLSSLLYNVVPLDPAAYGIAASLLLLVAALAAWLPARRASRIDPMVALRGD